MMSTMHAVAIILDNMELPLQLFLQYPHHPIAILTFAIIVAINLSIVPLAYIMLMNYNSVILQLFSLNYIILSELC